MSSTHFLIDKKESQSVLVHICTKFNVQIGAGRHLQVFGQASLSGACRGYMPPRLKTKQTS